MKFRSLFFRNSNYREEVVLSSKFPMFQFEAFLFSQKQQEVITVRNMLNAYVCGRTWRERERETDRHREGGRKRWGDRQKPVQPVQTVCSGQYRCGVNAGSPPGS